MYLPARVRVSNLCVCVCVRRRGLWLGNRSVGCLFVSGVVSPVCTVSALVRVQVKKPCSVLMLQESKDCVSVEKSR